MIFLRVLVNMLKKIFFLFLFTGVFYGEVFTQSIDTLRGTLREVEVKTKYNPAIPVIKKAIQNRNQNGQFSNHHFSYTSYQSLIFTGNMERDSVSINKVLHSKDTLLAIQDTNYLKTVHFFENYHIFFMETVTKNYFKKPAKSYEKVVAHRTAGLKDPLISIYLAKLQEINFYERDMLDILESPYVNPVSQYALTIYDYCLLEKVISDSDTLFVISFQPKKGAHFKSLTGKIWITSSHYAFTKIEAYPFDKELGLSFQLSQEYEKQPNNTYFLKDMFVRIDIFNAGVGVANSGGIYLRPVMLSEKRISDIDYETRLRARDFGFADIDEDLEDEATQKTLLETYRPVPLTEKEANTLVLMDSIAKLSKFDRKLESIKILITGKIPISVFNIDLNQILYFNSTENVRLGLGIYTNDRLSKIVNFGGFFGYGFKDKTWKWGGELGFNVMRSRDFKVVLNYYSTLMENGGTQYYDRGYTLFSGEFYRSWLFKRLYRSNALGVTVQSRLTRWLTGYASTFYSKNETVFNYGFQHSLSDDALTPYAFDDYYVKVGARFAFRERYWGADQYYFYSISPFPVITIQYSRGIKGVWNSDFNYNRIDLKVKYRKDWKILGFTNLTVYAGYVDCLLPAPLLFNQRAGYYSIGLDGADQFGAMRADEFLSDTYISVLIRHNFGRMTQNKKFSPRFIFCQGIAFGGLKTRNMHDLDFSTMEKGYFESGLVIDDLLVIKGLLSFGVGTFVRYGPYYLPKPEYKTIDNFAFKVSFRVPFER